ncbi:hypothetical protein KY495_01755 [Massilia sp. PAMC28688]|uniref:hypothetical protein n=1 Tax=Massilia sp. PAMC28688 TaxID=2861283 RepID=UPI001C62AF21|nr:hypothetical protein [Massilia sp. PAMC28688]QYF93992.1 hypothetical protein KY495_01755 [Massilia sp. PAMC28688]
MLRFSIGKLLSSRDRLNPQPKAALQLHKIFVAGTAYKWIQNMDKEIGLRRIESVPDYDAFVDLALELGTNSGAELFDFLFTQSLAGGRAGGLAACLMVEIDPRPTRCCKELLAEIARSNWDVSTKEVPFYLITWFGKHFLMDAYRSLIEETRLTPEQQQRVSTILYWTASPTANLIRSYHDWPWRAAEDSE